MCLCALASAMNSNFNVEFPAAPLVTDEFVLFNMMTGNACNLI